MGDCLFLDIQAFLPARCLEDGTGVNFTFAVSKNGPALRNQLKTLASRTFDLVFYSPLTYAFLPSAGAVPPGKRGLARIHHIRAAVEDAMSDVQATLNILATRFQCPVFVHNTANIRRHDGRL